MITSHTTYRRLVSHDDAPAMRIEEVRIYTPPRGWRELLEHQGKYFVADAITIRTSSYTDLDGNVIDAGALYRHTVSARQVTPTSFGEPTTISIGWGDLRHVLGDAIAHDLHGIAC
ncbi:hypothetical protein [Rhodococcus sp. WY5]|uniref:hypothetical protein n=1 Tax=Rhodococcus sp. WY5 TaxID=2708349 RepID=UPI001BDE8E76|nr:hypothetical protein [Rhodococcus sp. WY5]